MAVLPVSSIPAAIRGWSHKLCTDTERVHRGQRDAEQLNGDWDASGVDAMPLPAASYHQLTKPCSHAAVSRDARSSEEMQASAPNLCLVLMGSRGAQTFVLESFYAKD